MKELEEQAMNNDVKLHLIGNAHIDPVWLWRWQEGYAEIKATFRSALDRMNEFPDFIFTCACASYYQWVEENAPDMFEEIKERVREGRWSIVGGWWIQPDCNMPSGESFARHSLYSQGYFRKKFGKMSKVGYNVDSFGHNGMLPQILKKSGMDYYVFMRPGPHEKELPGDVFWWESEDGSRVLTFRIPFSYGQWYGNTSGDHTEDKLLTVLKMAEERNIDLMNFYGVGNHGGGPTIANLEVIGRLQEQMGGGKLILSYPGKYFENILDKGLDLPVVKDDLQHHASGCYSTFSEIKANNRKAEHRLLTAEKFAVMANQLAGLAYPGDRIQRAWEKVMFNQFHDILCGCSIKEAYQDARESHGEALNIGAEILNSAVQKISWAIDTMGKDPKSRNKEKDWYLWEHKDQGVPLVVFNPLSWKVKAPVQINKQIKGVTDDQGVPLEIQTVRGPQTNRDDKWNTMFIADIPPFGYRLYWVYIDKEFNTGEPQEQLHSEAGVLENGSIRLELDTRTGYIKRLYDKVNKVEVLSGAGAVPVVIDISHCDTWAHGVFEFRDEVARFADAEMVLAESGPIRSKLRVTSRHNQSVLIQDFILYKHKPDIEVQVKLDWREKHKLLKLSFPVNVQNPEATYEIPYGYIQRPVNGEEEPGQQWMDVTGMNGAGQYGLSLLNDCKYSFDIKENDMRLTVVNSSMFAEHFGERDGFCEFMEQGIHEFKYSIVPHAGSWRDAGVVKKAYELNVQPVYVMETYHHGPLKPSVDGIHIEADNILATAFKKSEDGTGYILRCYETSGRETETSFYIPMLNRRWTAVFGKCEIKTFLIPEDTGCRVMGKNLLEL